MDGSTSTAIQIGITSFTYGVCSSSVYPDIFTRVSTYAGWIKYEIKSDTCTAEAATKSPTLAPTPAPATPSPTPYPTPGPTEEDCLLDKLTHIIDFFLPS